MTLFDADAERKRVDERPAPSRKSPYLKLREGLGDVSRSLYEAESLTDAERSLDRASELLAMPWAWWTPDTAQPYECRRAEQFSRDRGWPKDLMRLWRSQHITLHSPFHIRSRFEHVPFVTLPDVRARRNLCSGYARANQIITEIGIASMVHVPIHLAKGRIAMVSWAGEKEPAEWDQLLPEISGDLLAIGHLFMRIYLAEFGQNSTVAEERARLTLREWDCLRTLAQGYREAEAAELLQISKSTLRFHIENVVRKFGCRNRTHAVALAAQLGLLGPIGH
jgi:DNA-binding CsgD family transcriptional regulator